MSDLGARDLSIVAIIPLYNGAKYIERAVRSVWAQTRLGDEVIVVNDGSTDGGPEIVERLADEGPIKVLHKPNGGQSSARNYGVAHSKSSLIAFLDQDDVWYPNHLAELIEPFQKQKGLPLGWVYSDIDEIDESGHLLRRSILASMRAVFSSPRATAPEHPKRTLIGCLKHDMFILPSASLISRTAFETVGGFDERLSGYEDDDLFLKMFRASFENIFIDRPLSQWRIYDVSTSYTERMSRSRQIYLQKLLQEYPDDLHRSLYYRRDYIAPRFTDTLLSEYRRAYRVGDWKQTKARVEELKLLLPYLRRERRLILSTAIPFMSNRSLLYLIAQSSFLKKLAANLYRH
jgi:glycosyltransferase involved in cell wall biosynthesis